MPVSVGNLGCALGLPKGDLGFQIVGKLAQHFCGFEVGLASRIAESGVWVPDSTKRDAKELRIDASRVVPFCPAIASQQGPQD